MKTVFKVLAVLLVLLIVLVVGVVIFAISNINGLVKTGIEKGGTYATGSMTTVEKVEVGIFGGTMSMDTLEIANPSGFTTPFFFELASADVRADWASYNEPKIRVPRVKLSGIEVYLDKGGNPSNYNTILNHIKSLESGSGSAPSKDGSERSVLIDSLVLENIQIHVANMPGVSLLAGDVAVTIPRIELQNVGEKTDMSVGEVVTLVVKTVLSSAIKAGGGIIPSDVLGDLSNTLSQLESLKGLGIGAIGDVGSLLDGQAEEVIGDLQKQGQQVIDDAKKQVEDKVDDAKKQVEDTVNKGVDDAKNEIEKGINNILGGKKKKTDG